MRSVTSRNFFTMLVGSLVLFRSLAVAVEPGQVEYVGGTVPGLKEGAVGRLDLAPESALRFEAGGIGVEIPYASIESFEYTREVTHHLGVLPAIAVGMARSRKHRHFVRISYSNGAKQVVVFEVPKNLPQTLLAVLSARAPQVCREGPRRCQH